MILIQLIRILHKRLENVFFEFDILIDFDVYKTIKLTHNKTCAYEITIRVS